MSLAFLIADAYAQTAPATAPVANTASSLPATIQSTLGQFVPLFLIFGVFYFMLIRPQQKRVNDHKAMIENLRRGDKVVTGGGIVGTVVRVEDDEAVVEVASNVQLRVVKNMITQVNAKIEPAGANTPEKP